MQFYNDFKIETAERKLGAHPTLGQAVRVLAEYRDILNQNSDGWGSYTSGTRVAGSLIDVIERGDATSDEVKKAISRVKRFCTRRGFPHPASA